ncbi:protein DpdG [Sphingopyxis granuli]|uniref:protein DpdG n=1 Tax=Sphingopyxis granuli TaxID=267128 RepID=UPI000835359E|nr:protein DpdG [Sphingopyxis granuli]
MTILNRPSDGLYNVLIILVRAAVRFSPRDTEQLLAACGSMIDSFDAGHLGRTLTRWTSLGLFEVGKDTFAIAEPYRAILGTKPDVAEARLPDVARRLVLKEENNARFWDAEGAQSADFSRGAAWMLAQDVYAMPSTVAGWESLAARQIADPRTTTIIQNDTRWNGLRAWMPYLGFARDAGSWNIDPTEAVRDTLPDIFGSAKILLAGEFVGRLSEAVPILDGGKYRREVEAALKDGIWPRPNEGSVSTSLSRALQRLDREGSLKLEQRSDAGEGISLTGRAGKRWRDVSHINFVAKKVR